MGHSGPCPRYVLRLDQADGPTRRERASDLVMDQGRRVERVVVLHPGRKPRTDQLGFARRGGVTRPDELLQCPPERVPAGCCCFRRQVLQSSSRAGRSRLTQRPAHFVTVIDVHLMETTFDDPAVDARLEQWNTEIGFVPKGGSTVEIDDFAAPGGAFLVGMTDGVLSAAAESDGYRQGSERSNAYTSAPMSAARASLGGCSPSLSNVRLPLGLANFGLTPTPQSPRPYLPQSVTSPSRITTATATRVTGSRSRAEQTNSSRLSDCLARRAARWRTAARAGRGTEAEVRNDPGRVSEVL